MFSYPNLSDFQIYLMTDKLDTNEIQTPSNMLVLGGCRSGKSRFAEEFTTKRFAKKLFVATLEAKNNDPEMARRISLHRASRAKDWDLVEEPVNISEVLQENASKTDCILVDCLTLWITNLILRDMPDAKIEKKVHTLAETAGTLPCPVILVANEVGLGIVPDSSLGRRFRDLAGWTNQQMAQLCDEVIFVAAGLPLRLKGHDLTAKNSPFTSI